MEKRSKRRRAVFSRGWWIAFSLGLVASVVLAEGLAYVYISTSGIIVPLKEGCDFQGDFRDYTAAYTHTYTLVENSERLTCGKTEGETNYRLAVLGDSFGYGVGVADCQDFSSLVNQQLPTVEVRNVSQAAAGMEQYLSITEERICGGGFDGVFLVLCGNDFLDSPESLLMHWSKHSNVAGLAYSLMGRPPPNTWAIRFLAGLGIVEAPAPGTPLNLTWWQKTVQPVRGNRRLLVTLLDDLSTSREFALHLSEPPADRSARNIELFHDLLSRAEECSTDIWVAVVPNGAAYSVPQREFIASYGGVLPPLGQPGSVGEMARKVAEEHGARFVETDRAFAPEADAAYYVNDIHWTARGHQIMAARLLDAVTEHASDLKNQDGNSQTVSHNSNSLTR